MVSRDCSICCLCCGVAWIMSSIFATRLVIICCQLRPALPCAHAPAPTRMVRAPSAITILLIIVPPWPDRITEGPLRMRCGGVSQFYSRLQVFPGLERLLDARAGVSDLEVRRDPGERADQLYVLSRQLGADVVGDLGQRPVALVVALADQPLPEELLVQHLLILAALEPLLA